MLMAQDISHLLVCVWCVHECESSQINWPEVEPVWIVIIMHFSNLQYEEMPNKHDEYQYSTREDKCFVGSMQVCEISCIRET